MLREKCHVWIITGYTGVGKTTLVDLLVKKTKVEVLAFGSVARQYCQKKGYTGVRNYFDSESETQFVNNINKALMEKIDGLVNNFPLFVIEGLPSIVILNDLRKRDNVFTTVIYLQVSAEIRKHRILQRAKFMVKDAEWEEFSKNRFKQVLGLEEIIASADYIIDAEKGADDIANEIIQIIYSELT